MEEENNSLYWVPMFAVNDWESTTKVYNSVHDGRLPEGTKHVIAMNNRADRTDRASMFVDVITKDLKEQFDKIVLYGDIQDAVYQKLVAGGVHESNILTTTDIEETDGKALVAVPASPSTMTPRLPSTVWSTSTHSTFSPWRSTSPR